MSTNNKVFQVLVTKGNAALPAKGAALETLADGQLGVFDAKTNLAIDGTTPVKEFYLAVGVDADGDTVVDNINFSAGQVIQKENIRDYTYKPHTASRPMVFEITDYKVNCDTEYAVKLEFRNMQVYMRQGYNAYAKTFSVKTDCCDELETGSVKDLTAKLLQAFNSDAAGMFKAEAITGGASLSVTTAPTVASDITVSIGKVDVTVAVAATDTVAQAATKIANAITASSTAKATAVATSAKVLISGLSIGTVITVDEGTTLAVVAVEAVNTVTNLDTVEEGINTGIRITTIPLAIQQFCGINTMYYNPRQTVVIPSLIEGFNCTGKVTITQTALDEEGSGYDIKQKEYHAGGWNGKPGVYRASTALGLAMPGFKYFADEAKKYDQFNLIYDQFSTAGWKEYLNNLMTLVAIPGADTVTRNSFASVMDAILSNAASFEALADDALAANVNPAVVEANPPASAAVDGIA